MKSLGVGNFDMGIVAIGEDIGTSVLVVLCLKKLGIGHVVAKAMNEVHGNVLDKVGADKIVFPERDMGIRVARSLAASNILDYIELSPDYSIMEIKTPKSWINKTIKDLNVRARFGLNIVAIKRGSSIDIVPTAEYAFLPGDSPVVIGKSDDIRKLGN